MAPEDVAALFDDRPGFKLIDFEEVGLPVYRLNTTLVTLEPKIYPPIEEFALKCIDAGLTTASNVAGLLGIDLRVIEENLSNLVRDDDIFVASDGKLSLTKKSQQALKGEEIIKPRDQTVPIFFDGLTRRPCKHGTASLVLPKDLRDRGIREIRAFPARKPEPDEIDIRDIEDSLKTIRQTSKKVIKILRIKEIGRKESRYLPAVALMYKSKTGSDIRVGFAIDGRLSEEHEGAFLSAGGVEKLGIQSSIIDAPPKPSLAQVIGGELASEVEQKVAPEDEAEKLKRRIAISKFRAELIRNGEIQGNESGFSSQDVASDESEAKQGLTDLKVRPIAVYEHPPLLDDALQTSQRRLLIISPWITQAVVTPDFLMKLESALDRGVSVHIGYGLDDRKLGRRNQNRGELDLLGLAAKDARLRIVRLGDTHAKVVLKDSDWVAVSSFNWLSFRGDPKRTFREEWGTLVRIPSVVNKFYKELLVRLQSGSST